MTDLRKQLRHLLEQDDIAAAASLVKADRKALTALIRLAYDKETLVGWRSVLAVGAAARLIASKDHAFLRETCRKLLWSLSDESGGIGWSAPEMLGEIVAADPLRFADLVPIIAGLFDIEEDTFRPGVLYALKRIAEQEPGLVLPHHQQIVAALAEKEPRTRILGLQVLALLWSKGCREGAWEPEQCGSARRSARSLLNDRAEAWIYGDNAFQSILVCEAAELSVKYLI